MNEQVSPPPRNISILERLVSTYKLWHEFIPHIPKTARYTLGEKIDSLFVETIENLFLASITPKEKKFLSLEKASVKLDLVKFFLQVAWEIKALDNKKYIMLSKHLNEIGRMLGGWLRQTTR